MPLTNWVSVLSLTLALLALASTIWQARRAARLTRNSHQIQVIADAFREIRSPGFLEHYRRVLDFPEGEVLDAGFESLTGPRKESAYAVSYFFEHLGVLVTRQLVPGDVLIVTMRTLIIRSWNALSPAINAELAARKKAYPEHMGHDFLPHFRQLVDTAEHRQGTKPAIAELPPSEPSAPVASRQSVVAVPPVPNAAVAFSGPPGESANPGT
jgi:hypothetical protein